MEVPTKYHERAYLINEVCSFRKTREEFGGLSNMASGYPLKVNGITILSSEAIYQACRFPDFPEVQEKIILQKSPMSAKMVGKPHKEKTREDWDRVRIEVMYWCLRVKLAQNFMTFGQLLESTNGKPIVEISSKDQFWGTVKAKNSEHLIGINALGRLLMKLRQEYNSAKRFDLLCVEPVNISNFVLLGEPIRIVDERQTFLRNLESHWKLINSYKSNLDVFSFKINKEYQLYKTMAPSIQVKEPKTTIKRPPKKTSKKSSRKSDTSQARLSLD